MEMDICGNLIGQTNSNRDQNGNNISWPLHIWELNSSRFDLDWATGNSLYGPSEVDATAAATGGGTHGLWLQTHEGDGVVPGNRQHQLLYAGDNGTHFHPDPHLMCLKLGKRHYFEDATVVGGFSAVGKRGKGIYGGGGDGGPYGPVSTTVPRCQVEGCHVALVNAKDYHRRHRVCEMHSKAPRVVVLGLEQRFCQQCSRFHVVSEFDDSKRSCRRRLAGHNERRRKSSHESVAARSSSQDNRSMSGKFPYLPSGSPTGRALSLLSSKNDCWTTTTPSDLSLRSRAALRELIAENRATVLARQLFFDREWHSNHHQQPSSTDDFSDVVPSFYHHQPQHPMYSEQQPPSWNGGAQVTLDLMQAPSNAFGLLSMRGKSKEEQEEEECSDLWNSFHDSHMFKS